MQLKKVKNLQYKLEHFEGPLEVLLKLIQKCELAPADVCLLDLCAQLDQEISEPICSLDLSASGYQLAGLTQLAQEKIQVLISLPVDHDESQELLLWQLFDNLNEYSQMKDFASWLFSHQSARQGYYCRPSGQRRLRVLSLDEAQEHLQKGLKMAKKPSQLCFKSFTTQERYTLKDSLDHIQKELTISTKLSFKSLFGQATLEICICHFLALLELLKLCRIQLVHFFDQSDEEMWIEAVL